MVDDTISAIENDTEEASAPRVYEIGYIIVPTVKEEDVEKTVGGIRSEVEKVNGNFIAEGAPSLMRLSYPMQTYEGEKRVEHDRGYFGWIKFEAVVTVAHELEEALKKNKNIMRFIIFRTVREDTRARMKAQTLREVKRTDTIHAKPRRAEEKVGPVSEEELEKALQDITQE
ncbi:hypothetical protein A2853_03095 [Candidatus Kaiserbacteria bacterium RIFCSPHIGHO2_01_FULL_55_17]|uniref:Small ribosomal subunit protein bS6 n=1 Tax=Candidatus Kaiserbacteria bacterium RIFCSPHIGHO2_01_FULL_55_17 TaxID=1798484 RepID=A0A1F6D8W2_9BACT|nr:MAG: hypothetical protein A2853_03095 [Candidatus Kaiserbacteria bacterium RIFCSPHIGHO2_01_FULL_55_17]